MPFQFLVQNSSNCSYACFHRQSPPNTRESLEVLEEILGIVDVSFINYKNLRNCLISNVHVFLRINHPFSYTCHANCSKIGSPLFLQGEMPSIFSCIPFSFLQTIFFSLEALYLRFFFPIHEPCIIFENFLRITLPGRQVQLQWPTVLYTFNQSLAMVRGTFFFYFHQQQIT